MSDDKSCTCPAVPASLPSFLVTTSMFMDPITPESMTTSSAIQLHMSGGHLSVSSSQFTICQFCHVWSLYWRACQATANAQPSVPHADCEFADLGIGVAPVRVLVQGAIASFERCTFRNNSVPSTSVGVITASVHAVALRLADCTFSPPRTAATPRAVVDANGSALIFSDDSVGGVWLTEGAARSAGVDGGNSSGVLTAARPLSEQPRNVAFLTGEDAWLLSVQAVRCSSRYLLPCAKTHAIYSHTSELGHRYLTQCGDTE